MNNYIKETKFMMSTLFLPCIQLNRRETGNIWKKQINRKKIELVIVLGNGK